MNLQGAQQFVGQFIRGESTPGDYAAFLVWLKDATVEELTIIADMHESMQGEWVLPKGPSAKWMEQLEQKLNKSAEEQGDESQGESNDELVTGGRELAPVAAMMPKRVLRWKVWTAAAAVVALSAGTYIYVHQISAKRGWSVDKEKLLSMTFSNPRGSAQKEMTFEDGSKVWLNAGSVLKYPPHFSGSERLVELSGEAFFEVTASMRPFEVKIRDAEVDVLGTFFEIMAYEDEPVSRTTLVNGSVKVMAAGDSAILKPGDQAEISYSPAGYLSPGAGRVIIVNHGIDPNYVLKWRMGIYRFDSTELHAIMRELERVYNITVQYQPGVGNPTITGSLDLNRSLDVALNQLESFLKVQFNHNGKTVIVSPT